MKIVSVKKIDAWYPRGKIEQFALMANKNIPKPPSFMNNSMLEFGYSIRDGLRITIEVQVPGSVIPYHLKFAAEYFTKIFTYVKKMEQQAEK